MKLLDSSVWLEVLIDGPKAAKLERYIPNDSQELVVPTLVAYEVHRHLLRKIGENEAVQAIAQFQRFRCEPIDMETALLASGLSLKYRLGSVDALILAVSRRLGATLITLNNDFRDIEGCEVVG